MDARAAPQGYDCSFVIQPQEEIQTECAICTLILRDPSQLECGHVFCTQCIERALRVGNNSCPLCNRQNPALFADLNLKRTLERFRVYCEHHRERGGCRWEGELGELDAHLNANPSRETQLDGCPYVKVECKFCKKRGRRSYLLKHQENDCPQRRYSCQYCGYTSTYGAVTEHHMLECPNVLIPCHLCETEVKRSDVDEHIRDTCTHAAVDCDFRPVGCGVFLTRGELSNHLEEYRGTHSALLKGCINNMKKPISEKMNNAMEEALSDLRWEIALVKYRQESRQEIYDQERQENVYTINGLKEEKDHLWKVIWFLTVLSIHSL